MRRTIAALMFLSFLGDAAAGYMHDNNVQKARSSSSVVAQSDEESSVVDQPEDEESSVITRPKTRPSAVTRPGTTVRSRKSAEVCAAMRIELQKFSREYRQELQDAASKMREEPEVLSKVIEKMGRGGEAIFIKLANMTDNSAFVKLLLKYADVCGEMKDGRFQADGPGKEPNLVSTELIDEMTEYCSLI